MPWDGLFATVMVVSFFVWFHRFTRREHEWMRKRYEAEQSREVQQLDQRALWTPGLMEVIAVHPLDDPVAQYLQGQHWEKYQSYMEARLEFRNAWRVKRLPHPWAQQIIRLYREVYAFSMEYEAAVGQAALRQVRGELLGSLSRVSQPSVRRPHLRH
jgi:hypothetical protein